MTSMKTFELASFGTDRAVPLIGHETMSFLMQASGPWARPYEPGRSVRSIGIIGGFVASLNRLLTAFEERRERARLLGELERLDDRMLADIGLARYDLREHVRQMRVEPKPSLVRRAWRAFKEARARRATARQLYALSDAVLADIGIERGQIRAYAAGELDIDRGARKSHVVKRLATSLRQWNLSRQAVSDMVRIDAKLMADIGYVKGDVDWVPEVLANRRLEAANRNAGGEEAA